MTSHVKSGWGVFRREVREAAVPLGFLAAACVAMTIAVLVRTGGVFGYTLDDPYIHLALAEEIARGHYGVNPNSFSAPSSSVLWPFLLAPWARLSAAVYVPLLYNILAAGLTVLVYRRVMVLVIGPGASVRHRTVIGISVVGLLVMTNVVGLIFTGMEHSLQVLLVALVVLGLWRGNEANAAPWWLFAALVLGPLVRYENLALTTPAFVYLFVRGYRRPVIVGVALVGAALGAFSAFLVVQGGGFLPSSVLAKSTLDNGISAVVGSFVDNMRIAQGRMLMVGIGGFVFAALSGHREKVERELALVFLTTAALQLFAGRFGWQSRYEVYAYTVVLLGLVLLYRAPVGHFLRREKIWKSAILCGALAVVVGVAFIKDTYVQPLAAQNIYEQQYQLHRFAAEYYPHPIAVNDLGWTTFRNDNFVLDLTGIGQYEVFDLKTAHPESDWISPLADAHGVGLLLVYRHWMPPLSETWELLGVLRRDGRLVGAGHNEVHIFARDDAAAGLARPALRAWAESLPAGVRFEWER